MKTDKETEKSEIEKGIWIVYDLEANREIQNLLAKKKFKFRFDPSLKIIEKEVLSKQIEKILQIIKKEINCPEYDSSIRELELIKEKIEEK